MDFAKIGMEINSGCLLTLWYIPEMGLGNSMFVYASLFGLSRNLSIPAVVATRNTFPLYSLFENRLLLPAIQEHVFYSPFTSFDIENEKCCWYPLSNVERLKNECKSLIRLNSYLQSWKYFHQYQTEIRHQFRCRRKSHRLETILNGQNNRFKAYDRRDNILVGVHARRGDFLKNKVLQDLGYTYATRDYLLKAMAIMKEKLRQLFPRSKKKPLFILLGNGYDWNLNNFRDRGDVLVIEPKSAFDDYCLLTRMEHTIFTVGTFGWWVAYMTEGVVIYDKNYARKNSRFASVFAPSDYFLPEWIGVEA